jgi:mutual gliding-motility protein MglA
MPLINTKIGEIQAKLVYTGPQYAGKTTNIRRVYESLPNNVKSELQIMPTGEQQTLFFDYFSVTLTRVHGMRCRIYVYGVPGQPRQTQARRMVLRGADAVVFVADSQADRFDENRASYADMKATLIEVGANYDRIPVVMQYNKRDLPALTPVERLDAVLNERHSTAIEAVALDGQGVVETFRAACAELVRNIVEQVPTLVVD